jgi:hypothetical protein
VEKELVHMQRQRQAFAFDPSTPGLFSYDLWTSHAVYDQSLHELVPQRNSFHLLGSHVMLVTIVREPMKRWLSAFEFYDLPKRKGFHLIELPHKEQNRTRYWKSPPRSLQSDGNEYLSSSEVAMRMINDVLSFVDANKIDRFAAIIAKDFGHVPWAFNGMSLELAGTVHGPLTSLGDAQVIAKSFALFAVCKHHTNSCH